MNGNLPNFFKSPHNLAQKNANEPILLALSGGADSSALLHLLCKYRELHEFPLYAAHVNHNIRTDHYNNEAFRDEEFCKSLCEKLKVQLFTTSLDIPEMAKEAGSSLETRAREARYSFFKQIMLENNIKILATAHNADDNLETQLFNLSRGCGIDGISGIPQVRDLDSDDCVAVRPLLHASKAEILNFCEKEGIPYVTDSTNSEDNCTRNILRIHVIPKLKEIFHTPEKSSLRLAHSASEDSDFILSVAKQFLSEHDGHIPLEKFRVLHAAVAKRVVLLAYAKFCNAKLEGIHIEDILCFAHSGNTGTLTLPHGIHAVFADGELIFKTQEELQALDTKRIDYHKPLSFGFNLIVEAGYLILVTTESAPNTIAFEETNYTLYTTALLKNVQASALYVAPRCEGEKIRDGGVGKKLKKLMCDKKIPQKLRNSLPIVRLGDEIVYVPNCAVADPYKATETNFDIRICIFNKKR